MKSYLFIFILIIPFFLNSQEINEAFFESLPEDLKEDIEDRATQQSGYEDPIYRSIESQTELEKMELEQLKDRLEADLEYLRQKLEDDERNNNKYELNLFGSDFFSTYQSTYMPVNEPNLNPSYILDFGDVLEIQLIGQISETAIHQIKRDGSINLPDIGPIVLGGLSLGEASSKIKKMVESSYIGTEAFVTLNNLRDINVLVSGNAYNPGIYTVTGNSDLLHVLGVAGGINENGSYREIQLIRDQKVIKTLDMYDVLITGQYSTKVSLRTGDVIFVKPVKNVVFIDGAVKVPAKYELLEGQYLSDVITYANGISSDADTSNIFLERILDGRIKSIPIKSIKQFDDILSQDGDIVYVRKHMFRNVSIEGAVLKPGRYLMAEGETLNDLLNKAGGYTENAYPFGAVYETQRAFVINKMAKDKLYEEFIDNIITVSQKNPTGQSSLNAIVELTQNLKNTQPNGRVVLDLLNEVDKNSMVIREGDRITIPEISNHIYIYGEVSYEGALKYEPSGDVDFYINRSGGLNTNASKESIYVLQPNGDTQRLNLGRKNLFQNSPGNEEMVLYPGSIIFVPRIIDNSATNRLAAQAYVSILGNIGIALASLSSINNN